MRGELSAVLSLQVPTDRPDVLLIIRVTYVLSQLLQFAVFYYAAMKVKQRNDTRVLKYQEAPKGFGVSAYDLDTALTSD